MVAGMKRMSILALQVALLAVCPVALTQHSGTTEKVLVVLARSMATPQSSSARNVTALSAAALHAFSSMSASSVSPVHAPRPADAEHGASSASVTSAPESSSHQHLIDNSIPDEQRLKATLYQNPTKSNADRWRPFGSVKQGEGNRKLEQDVKYRAQEEQKHKANRVQKQELGQNFREKKEETQRVKQELEAEEAEGTEELENVHVKDPSRGKHERNQRRLVAGEEKQLNLADVELNEQDPEPNEEQDDVDDTMEERPHPHGKRRLTAGGSPPSADFKQALHSYARALGVSLLASLSAPSGPRRYKQSKHNEDEDEDDENDIEMDRPTRDPLRDRPAHSSTYDIERSSWYEEAVRAALRVLVRCRQSLSEDSESTRSSLMLRMRECLGARLLSALDRLVEANNISLADGVLLVRNSRTLGLARDGADQDTEFLPRLLSRLRDLASTHDLHLSYGQATGRSLEEGRRRHQYRKVFPVLVTGFMILMSLMVPLGFQFMAMIGGKALLMSKMALIMSSMFNFRRNSLLPSYHNVHHQHHPTAHISPIIDHIGPYHEH